MISPVREDVLLDILVKTLLHSIYVLVVVGSLAVEVVQGLAFAGFLEHGGLSPLAHVVECH